MEAGRELSNNTNNCMFAAPSVKGSELTKRAGILLMETARSSAPKFCGFLLSGPRTTVTTICTEAPGALGSDAEIPGVAAARAVANMQINTPFFINFTH